MSSPSRRHTKQIAPRLKSGPRERFGARFDPVVNIGLKAIARQEGKSRNWVIEEVVIRFFGLKHSPYLYPQKKTPARRKAA